MRHLLSHSAGLDLKESWEGLANKSNAELLAASAAPPFPPGTAFTYCNLCSITLALLIERVSGLHYLEFVKARLAVPSGQFKAAAARGLEGPCNRLPPQGRW